MRSSAGDDRRMADNSADASADVAVKGSMPDSDTGIGGAETPQRVARVQEIDPVVYDVLGVYANKLLPPVREIIGREKEEAQILSALQRPELSNVLLLGPAGIGKTTTVQQVSVRDTSRIYLEIDLSRMISDLENPAQMAGLIKELFDQAERYSAQESSQLVLFIDEFHQIVQLSPAAVEALKPVLAASGARGILVIAATTFEEYREWIAPNLPLVERLQRVNLKQLDRATTVNILRNMAKKYDVDKYFSDDSLLHRIVDLTTRYVPASVQPRQSIRVLDAAIGRHRFSGEPIDRAMIDDVLMESTNINVDFKVDGTSIEEKLNERVFAQQRASSVINKRLQVCVADLHDKTRPMASFLFVGSTGVGKALADDTMVPMYDPEGKVFFKRHGDLKVGDMVFSREGHPERVVAVFPQGKQEFYRITFTNGRTIEANASHMWPIYTDLARKSMSSPDEVGGADSQEELAALCETMDGEIVPWKVMSTAELIAGGTCYVDKQGKYRAAKFFVPVSQGVHWDEADLPIDPYVLGVFVASGVMRTNALTLRHPEKAVIDEVARRLGCDEARQVGPENNWVFPLTDAQREHYGLTQATSTKYMQLDMVFGEVEELYYKYTRDRRIPEVYLTASFAQRMELVRGLFDAGGYIRRQGYTVHYQSVSRALLEQIRQLLASLGIDSSISDVRRGGAENDNNVDSRLIVRTAHADKPGLFMHSVKRETACEAAQHHTAHPHRYNTVGIRAIEPIGEQTSQCIMVDHPEHSYQAGEFVVTHNTEMAKQLAQLMFNDETRRLIRFDMSEFSTEDRAEAFRSELTGQVSDYGHAVLLIDEVEKAHPNVYRLLLQVLDDGRLSDDNGRQVTFLNTYIILTTNVGSGIFSTIGAYAASDTGDGSTMEDFEERIYSTLKQDGFPPELLGRVDAVVPFQPLSQNTKSNILQRKMRGLYEEVAEKHGVRLHIESNVLDYLDSDKERAATDSGGARDAVRTLNNEVVSKVAEFINANPQVSEINVRVVGQMRKNNKNLRRSKAAIEVVKTPGSRDKVRYR